MVVFSLVHREDVEEKDTNQKSPMENKKKEGETDNAYEPKDDDLD